MATTVVSYAAPGSPDTGSAVRPHLQSEADPDFYLIPGPLRTFTNSGAELEGILGSYSAPVVVDGELRWSDEWYAGGSASE